jgi:hypothetical protein
MPPALTPLTTVVSLFLCLLRAPHQTDQSLPADQQNILYSDGTFVRR